MTVVVGTAGHIDHGKTSLLRALTGIDADRLPEERRRGMTIDVGYAHLRLPDGDEIDFVDVPGHDRLVGNMLVGAGEIDAALLVVAADDGPRAQTLEHLELLDGLGIGVGVAAVTKVDLVDAGRAAEVVAAVRDLLGRTTLADSSVVAVSSTTGTGLDELRRALEGVRVAVHRAVPGTVGSTPPGGPRPPRLAVDRAFSVRGRGKVVTGTLRGGPLARGDPLRLEPAGVEVRVRELQVHGAPVERVGGGGRVAINLAGAAQPERGDVLSGDRSVRATGELIAVVRAAPRLDPAPAPTSRTGVTAPWPPAPGSAVRVHLGTDAVDARVGRGRRDTVDLPDGRRILRLRLAHTVAAADGDRLVLRRPSPGGTIGGGIVIDALPPVGPSRRRARPDLLAGLAAEDAAVASASRIAIHGVVPAADGAGLAGRDVAEDVVAAVERAADEAAAESPVSLATLRPALGRTIRRLVTVDPAVAAAIAGAIVDRLVSTGRLVRQGDLVARPGVFESRRELEPQTVAAMEALERALAVPAPPSLAEAARVAGCSPEGVRALETAGRIVRLEPDLAYAASTLRELESAAIRLADAGPLSPAAFRDATGTSRKYVMAILEELDRRGVLRRTPAGHVRGPRAIARTAIADRADA